MKKVFLVFFLAVASLASYAKPDFEIPEPKAYDSAEECRKDNDIALKVAKFYLDANLPDDVVWAKDAASFLLTWITASGDITLVISDKRCEFLKCKDKNIGSLVLMAYMSGCVDYCLENKQHDHDFNMHYFALTKMMEYYEKNREITGSDKEMDKLLANFKKKSFKEKEEKKFK